MAKFRSEYDLKMYVKELFEQRGYDVYVDEKDKKIFHCVGKKPDLLVFGELEENFVVSSPFVLEIKLGKAFDVITTTLFTQMMEYKKTYTANSTEFKVRDVGLCTNDTLEGQIYKVRRIYHDYLPVNDKPSFFKGVRFAVDRFFWKAGLFILYFKDNDFYISKFVGGTEKKRGKGHAYHKLPTFGRKQRLLSQFKKKSEKPL